jgi:phage terminase large subunit
VDRAVGLAARAFEWTKTRIVSREAPDHWFAVARTWPKSADAQQQAETLAGIHADHVMFVIDEVGSVPQAVVATAEAVLATGRETKLLIAGNPTRTDGPLYRACTQDRHLWRVIEVTGDPDRADRAPRVKLEWAREQIASYGRSSPWVMVNVLGEFPPASINALLGPDDVQAAIRRHLTEDAYTWAQKRLGVDVSRYGGDATTLFPRQGLVAHQPRLLHHARGSAVSVDIASHVMTAVQRWGAELVLLDATGGWAAGASDVLRASGYAPVDVQFAAPAFDPRFANRRAEMWWSMAEWVQRGGVLPDVPELQADLTSVTYSYDAAGRLLLEPKDAVRARLGRSPDVGDALALTFGLPERPAGLDTQGKATTDYDPYGGAFR